MLDRFMKQLAKEMELSQEIPLSEKGIYRLPLEEDLSVEVTAVGGDFLFSSLVAPCPTENVDLFYMRMMLANLFGQGTLGAILGLNQEGNYLVLSRSVENRIEYKEFRDIIEDFVNSVDFWREEALNYR